MCRIPIIFAFLASLSFAAARPRATVRIESGGEGFDIQIERDRKPEGIAATPSQTHWKVFSASRRVSSSSLTMSRWLADRLKQLGDPGEREVRASVPYPQKRRFRDGQLHSYIIRLD